jgi:GNAT superfamily N-acetyltransferase
MSLNLGVFYAPDQLDAQRALFRACFPELSNEVEATEDWYQWKFHSFPHEPPSYEFAAHAEGILIGYYAALPYRYRLGSEQVTCGMVCDVMTAPQAQGKGVFTRLGEFALEQLSEDSVVFTSGYPIRRAVIPGHLKVGWKIAFRLPIYLKVVRSRSVLQLVRLGALAPAVDVLLRLGRFIRRSGGSARCEILERDEFLALPDYPEFFARWSNMVPNVLVKSAAFLRWRTGAPTRRYRFVTLRENGQLIGLAICRTTTLQGIICLAVLDLMTLPAYKSAFREIDQALVEEAVSEGASAIATMMSRHTAQQHHMPSNGYLKTPATFSLILRPTRQAVMSDAFMREDQWHLMWIDSDDI